MPRGRARFLRRLLPQVRLVPLVARAVRPVALAAGAAVALRLITWGGRRSAGEAIAEVVIFGVVYVLVTLRLDRALIDEVRTTFGGHPGAGEDQQAALEGVR